MRIDDEFVSHFVDTRKNDILQLLAVEAPELVEQFKDVPFEQVRISMEDFQEHNFIRTTVAQSGQITLLAAWFPEEGYKLQIIRW